MAFGGAAVTAAAAGDATDRFLLRHWGVEEGAPHNTFNGLIQSDDGFLWAATDAGLIRFDGVAFSPSVARAASDAKSGTIRSVIREDARTLLAVDGKSELIRIRDGVAGAYPLTVPPNTGNGIRCLFRESDHVFWISFLDGSLWRCSSGAVERFPPPARSFWGQPTFAVAGAGEVDFWRGSGVERYRDGHVEVVPGTSGGSFAIGSGRSGPPWVAEHGRLSRLDGGRLRPTGGPSWPAQYTPDLIVEGRDGAVWLGFANYGLLRWTPAGDDVVAEFRSRIKALLEDDQGDVWAATEGNGLNRLRPQRFALLPNASDTPAEAASSVCEDTAGAIWFAAHSSLRVERDGKLRALTASGGWPKSASWVCPDAAGHVWFTSGRALYEAPAGGDRSPRRVPLELSSQVRSLFAARDGAIWLGCETGPLIRVGAGGAEPVGSNQGYTGSKAEALAEDSDGTLWVGTGKGQLFRRRNGRFAPVDVAALLHGDGIRAIWIDRENWRWIGTDGRGLLAQHGDVSALIGQAQGLPDAVVSQLLEDDFGFIWFGTRRGLFKVRRQELVDCASGRRATVTPIVYGPDDGLSDVSAVGGHQPAAWKTRAGRLWFTARAGFVSTQPTPDGGQGFQPRVYLDGALADGTAVTDRSQISAATRRYAFRFTSPVFAAPERVLFRYRLDGFDPDWSEPTAQRSAAYPRLPAGRYRFVVAVSDGEGRWSPATAAVPFTVVPRWWETPGMRVLALLAGAGLLAAVVRYSSQRRLRRRLVALEQEQRVAAERERIARNLHDGLGAGLTHVGMMAEQLAEDGAGSEEARARAARLVDRVQGVARDLDAAVWAVSPRHDRLPALCSYVCEYALEFFRDTPIRCRVEIAAALPDRAISPEARHHLFLAAKEALNNALKHSGAAHVTLTVRREGADVALVVADDGHGFDVAGAAGSKRNGLRNLRDRINEAGGRLAVASSAAGTAVTILLPCPSP